MKPIHKTDTRIYRTAYGLVGLAVGLPVLTAGGFYFLVGAGILPLPGNPGGLHAPLWVLGAAGLSFVLAGGTLVVGSLRGIRHRRRAEAMRKSQPDEPWMADYPWEPAGIGDEAARRPGFAFLGVVLLGVFILPFNWWAFLSGNTDRMLKGIVFFFDLLWCLVLVNGIYRLAQWAKYRGSRLIFASFPFAPGEQLRVAFVPNRFSRLQATLRFVEERFESQGTGESRTTFHRTYQHYAESRTIEVEGNASRVLIEFDIPDRPEWVTRLTADPAIRYWELELRSQTPGIDFETAFPLPVYANSQERRVENPLFEIPAAPRDGVAAYGFVFALVLLIAGLLIARISC